MKKIYAIITAALLLCGCTQNDSAVTETAVSESVTAETVTEELVTTTTVENTSMAETTTEESVETVTIAGQEFPVDSTNVEIRLTDNSPLVTDISEIGKLKNIEYLLINNVSDGGPYAVDGLEAIKDCATISSICISAGLADEEDICVLETLPNLKCVSIYGVGDYDSWNFNLNAVEDLSLIGTIDLTKIEHLTNLKSLYLEYNNTTDLTPIEKLENLESLQIWESRFADYSSILELKNLKGLYISSTPMTNEMYDRLVENLPDCKITVANLEE